MKITIIENNFNYLNPTNGLDSYIKRLSDYCKSKQIQNTIVTCNNIEVVDDFFKLKSLANHPLSSLDFILKLRKKRKKINFEPGQIVLVNHPFNIFPFAFNKKIVKILILHGNKFQLKRQQKNILFALFYIFMQRIFFIFFDRIFLVNDSVLKWKTSKMIVSKAPVSISSFPLKNKETCKKELMINKKTILFVGMLEKEKGTELLMQLIPKLNQKYHFIIIGKGRYSLKIKRLINNLHLTNINLIEEVPHSDIHIYYNAADVLILTSLSEGTPLVIKEALVCNTPVVSTDVGDVKEVIKDLPGCYIVQPNVIEFLDKIELAINEKPYNYRKWVEQYSEENIFGKLMIELESMVNQ